MDEEDQLQAELDRYEEPVIRYISGTAIMADEVLMREVQSHVEEVYSIEHFELHSVDFVRDPVDDRWTITASGEATYG